MNETVERMIPLNQNRDPRIAQTVDWLRSKVTEAGAKGLIVGISGGIDSAVVANLIKMACPDNALGLILPISSQNNDVEDGIAVAMAAQLDHHVINFSGVHSNMIKEVINVLQGHSDMDEQNQRMSDANLRARLRMSTIYTVANMLNYLVVGTDNAAELYTGYFTKYGDGGVDLLPVGKLLKSEVYLWARQLNVPEQVIQRPPSAGLWEGQTDEEEMGITYDLIDRYLSGETIPEDQRSLIEKMHHRTMHKRQMPPLPNW